MGGTCSTGNPSSAAARPGQYEAALSAPAKASYYPVFLSFRVFEAKDQALALKSCLENAGIPAFCSSTDILQGDDWEWTIAEALDKCQLFVALATKKYGGPGTDSFATREELRTAKNDGKKLYVIKMTDRLEVPATRLLLGSVQMGKAWKDSPPDVVPKELLEDILSSCRAIGLVPTNEAPAVQEAPPPQEDMRASQLEQELETLRAKYAEAVERIKCFEGSAEKGTKTMNAGSQGQLKLLRDAHDRKTLLAWCQEYKHTLPDPGGAVAALFGQLAEQKGFVLANKDNLDNLFFAAKELLAIIIEKHTSYEELLANQAHNDGKPKPGSRKYCILMEQLQDLLEEILMYTRSFCDRNFIHKLLSTSYDREQYNYLADSLAQLTVDALFSLSIDTYTSTMSVEAMPSEMKEEMKEVHSTVCSRMAYTDIASELKRVVESLGGLDAVVGSEAKAEEVLKHLDCGEQVTIAMLKQVQASLDAAFLANVEGVHKVIGNADMRTLWAKCFYGLPKVKWDVWWCAFPGHLYQVTQDKEAADQVAAHLASDEGRAKFHAFVEKSDPETVSVQEIALAFPAEESVLDVVERAVNSA